MSVESDASEPEISVSDERTIAATAERALKALGKASTIREIYDFICTNGEYQFNTPVPMHVLRTTIRRHTVGADRSDMSRSLHFEEPQKETYWLVNTSQKKRAQIGMRRIQRAKDKEDLIEKLTIEGTGVFREKWRLILFAATLGFKLGRREPLGDVDTGRGIDQSSFTNAGSWQGMVYLMGLVERASTDLLVSSEEVESARIQMFEEFANGGLAYLKERCGEKDADLEFVLDLISEHTGEATPPPPDLSITI